MSIENTDKICVYSSYEIPEDKLAWAKRSRGSDQGEGESFLGSWFRADKFLAALTGSRGDFFTVHQPPLSVA